MSRFGCTITTTSVNEYLLHGGDGILRSRVFTSQCVPGYTSSPSTQQYQLKTLPISLAIPHLSIRGCEIYHFNSWVVQIATTRNKELHNQRVCEHSVEYRTFQ